MGSETTQNKSVPATEARANFFRQSGWLMIANIAGGALMWGLHFLAKRPGWVFTRYQIVDGIRGPNYPVTERAIDVQIVALRRKLGECGAAIETVRGVGYRFSE